MNRKLVSKRFFEDSIRENDPFIVISYDDEEKITRVTYAGEEVNNPNKLSDVLELSKYYDPIEKYDDGSSYVQHNKLKDLSEIKNKINYSVIMFTATYMENSNGAFIRSFTKIAIEDSYKSAMGNVLIRLNRLGMSNFEITHDDEWDMVFIRENDNGVKMPYRMSTISCKKLFCEFGWIIMPETQEYFYAQGTPEFDCDSPIHKIGDSWVETNEFIDENKDNLISGEIGYELNLETEKK